MTPAVDSAAGHSRVLDGFRRRLGPLWAEVEPYCADSGPDDLPHLVRQVRECSRPECARAHALASELEALLAGWPHYGVHERMVLRGAVSYLAECEDPTDDDEAGLDDDDAVVDAAVRVLLRRG